MSKQTRDTATDASGKQQTAVSSREAITLAPRGVARGHVVVGVLRTQIAEPWTLNALAQEVADKSAGSA